MQGSDRFITSREMSNVINLRITHKKAPIPVLEAVGFKDIEKTSKEIQQVKGVEECLVLQTCNRVEIYLSVSEGMAATSVKSVLDCWRMRAGFNEEDFNDYAEVAYGADAVQHLMRLASGLESMIVGEDQILGQIQDACDAANGCGASGVVLKKIFGRAVKMGKVVRVETNINKGAVSIGSIAVNLLEEVAGDIHGKKVLIIGAGRIGALTGKALAAKSLAFIFVANRTYERATVLAKMLNADAVKFDKLIESLAEVDIAIVTTAAPHYVLTQEKVKESMKLRENSASGNNNLLIIDLSQPRAVEKEVGILPGVELRNIDNLREIADANLKMRLKEANKAEAMIQNEMEHLAVSEKRADVEPLISAVSRKVNEIRQRELKKAYCLMKTDPSKEKCGHCQRVMDDLSRTLMEQMMLHPLLSLRSRELENDDERITLLRELFDVKTIDQK